jgi:antitoxin CptB
MAAGLMASDEAPVPLDARRKRLRYQSWHLGTRETDLMVGGFADRHLATLTDAQLDAFEALLTLPDADLFALITGRIAPDPVHDTDVLALLKQSVGAGRQGAGR